MAVFLLFRFKKRMDHPNLPVDHTPAPLECRVTGGFSSRLRAMASAAAWAVMRLNTTVQILWMPELGVFGAPASILFDMAAIPYWFQIQNAPFLPHTGWLTARQITSEDAMNAYVEVAAGRPLRLIAGTQFAQTMFMNECCRLFKPGPSILEAVDAAFGQIIGRTVIGVHYRGYLAAVSPREAFWAAMRAEPENALFYVASDDPAFVEAAVLQFPGQVTVGFKQAREPNNPEGNEQAAIDFFALARTTKILGSVGSGFGELAAAYGAFSYEEIRATG
jgi:hypothetical protein